jgi:hypothetical protein
VLKEETLSDEYNIILFALMVLPVREENVATSAKRSPVLIEETDRDEFRNMVFAVIVLPVREENESVSILMELHVIVDAVSILRFALFDHCAAPFVLIVKK